MYVHVTETHILCKYYSTLKKREKSVSPSVDLHFPEVKRQITKLPVPHNNPTSGKYIIVLNNTMATEILTKMHI